LLLLAKILPLGLNCATYASEDFPIHLELFIRAISCVILKGLATCNSHETLGIQKPDEADPNADTSKVKVK